MMTRLFGLSGVVGVGIDAVVVDMGVERSGVMAERQRNPQVDRTSRGSVYARMMVWPRVEVTNYPTPGGSGSTRDSGYYA
ncbi:hypothetical protein CLE01_05930 [Cryobacterium levicorallinum]|nr:hypothetical protein CLE01_05930 [Cryobacterium levicorallinum]